MERLPREILDLIYSNLDAAEARSSRVCCKTLADVGARHGFRQITFFLCRQDFQRLRDIAQHEIIRGQVRFLVYVADNLPAHPKSLAQYLNKTKNYVYRTRVEASTNNLLPPQALLSGPPRAPGSIKTEPIEAHHIQDNYRQYVAAVAEQREILSTREDFALLKGVLPRLTNLREISMRNAGWGMDSDRYRSPFDGFFDYTMCSLAPEGARQMDAVLHGLEGSGLQLNKLGAGSLNVDLIDKSFFDKIARSCGKGLERIQLCFDSLDGNASIFDDDTSEILMARHMTETGVLANFLKQLSNLTELSIEFTASSLRETLYPAALGNIILSGFQWHRLRELSLMVIETERTELLAVFRLHRETLRYICIRDCRLATTSWTRLFKQMKEILELEDIYVHGTLEGKIEDEQDYPSINDVDDDEAADDEGSTDAANDVEKWWLGAPDLEPDYSLSHGIADWFLRGKAYPLVRPRMRSQTAIDEEFEPYDPANYPSDGDNDVDDGDTDASGDIDTDVGMETDEDIRTDEGRVVGFLSDDSSDNSDEMTAE